MKKENRAGGPGVQNWVANRTAVVTGVAGQHDNHCKDIKQSAQR